MDIGRLPMMVVPDELLVTLYERGLSTRKIGALLGIHHTQVYRRLKKLGVIRPQKEAVRLANTKRWKNLKEPTREEKAILWWLAHTDAHVRKLRRQIEVSLKTPDPYLVRLYEDEFGKWAETKVTPCLVNAYSREKWAFNVLLPLEYHDYLLDKDPISINWRTIAMLVNTEGTISVTKDREKARAYIVIGSTEKQLLKRIQEWLRAFGVVSRLRKHKAKKRVQNKQMWYLWIERRSSIELLLRNIQSDLIWWKQLLARFALSTLHNDLDWKIAKEIRDSIKNMVRLIFKVSKEQIRKRLAESPPRPLNPFMPPKDS